MESPYRCSGELFLLIPSNEPSCQKLLYHVTMGFGVEKCWFIVHKNVLNVCRKGQSACSHSKSTVETLV